MTRTYIRDLHEDSERALIFLDKELKEVRIRNPEIIQIVEGREIPYVGLDEFDVIDYDSKTGRVIFDGEASNRVRDALDGVKF